MTIRPASIVFFLYQGATFTEPVTLRDANDALIDVTGCSARFQCRRDITDTTPIISISTTPNAQGSITLGGVLATVQLNISAAVTAALNIDPYGETWPMDLLLTSADGITVQKTYQGALVALPGVTR